MASDPADHANPFPGLRPFNDDEEYLFFGRDAQVDDLLARLRRRRFVAVVGTSGSGKSSLVRAGLLPSLYGGFMVGAASHWLVAIMRPGSSPMENLAQALDKCGALGEKTAEQPELRIGVARTVLESGALGLVEIAQHAGMTDDDNLLVVVDQFEELFRFHEGESNSSASDEAAAFVKLLLTAAARTDLRIYVVITMRSDFLGDCARFRDLPETVNDGLFLVPRMTWEQLQLAIAGPVGVAGAAIAPTLITRLLNDLRNDQDQLPVLQHALMRTWNLWAAAKQPNEPLDVPQYKTTGTMENALSAHANEIYKKLDARGKLLAERLFKCLTDLGADNRGIRRPTTFGQACEIVQATPAELAKVIEPFRAEGCSFLMPPPEKPLTPDEVLDISHESLMRKWDRLIAWVEAEAQSRQTYQRLADAAARHGKKEAALYRDEDLTTAVRWREENKPSPAWAQRFPKADFVAAMAFLSASAEFSAREEAARLKAAEDELRREREADRRKIESEEAAKRERLEHQAAVDRMRADSARAVSQRTRVAAIIMSAIAVVALALGALSWKLRADAESALSHEQLAEHGMQVAQAGKLEAETAQRASAEQLQRKTTLELKQSRSEHSATQRALVAERNLHEAEVQRRLAQSRQDQAQKAVALVATQTTNGIVSDVAETFRDRGVPVDVTRKVLDLAQGLQQQLTGLGATTPGLRRSEAAAQIQVATTLEAQGDTTGALASATRSQAIMQDLVATNARNADWQSGLSTSYRTIGDARLAQGDLAAARQSYRAGFAIDQKLATAEPNNLAWQGALAESYQQLGDVMSREGDSQHALENYRSGLQIRQRLAKVDVHKTEWQHDLAVAYGKVAAALRARGSSRDSLDDYLRDFTIVKTLAEANPNNVRWQSDLGAAYGNVGDAYSSRNKLSDALSYYTNDLAIADRLAKSDPGNATWQSDLSLAHANVGYAQYFLGHVADALTAFRESLGISERLAKRDSRNVSWQRALSTSYANVGQLLITQQNLSGALALYRQRLDIVERLAASEPKNETWQVELAAWLGNIAGVYEQSDNRSGAVQFYRRSVTVAEHLATLEPDNMGWQVNLSADYLNVGRVLLSQGNESAGLKAYNAGIAIRERLARSDPGNAVWQQSLSDAYEGLGRVLTGQGKSADGLANYRRGLAIVQRIAELDPDNSSAQQRTVVEDIEVGNTLRDQNNLTEALVYLQKGVTLSEQQASDPGNTYWQRVLAYSYTGLGDALVAKKDFTTALARYRSAIAIGEHLTKVVDPVNAFWQSDLASFYVGAGDVLSKQEQWPAAEKSYRDSLAITEKLAKSDTGNASWQLDLAIAYNRVGNVLYSQSNNKDALVYYRLANGIDEQLALRDPNDAKRQRNLFIDFNNIGGAESDPNAQRADYQRAVTIARALKAQGKLNSDDIDLLTALEKKIAPSPKGDTAPPPGR